MWIFVDHLMAITVTRRKYDDINKILTFHTTGNKQFRRKLPLILERTITVD